MITLTARIDLISWGKNDLSIQTNDLSINNISSDIQAILCSKKQGSNPFIIGASKLGDASTFSDKVDYFIGKRQSNQNGKFDTPYRLTISGTEIKSLTIEFDNMGRKCYNTINKIYFFIESIRSTRMEPWSIDLAVRLQAFAARQIYIRLWNWLKMQAMTVWIFLSVYIV